MPSGVRVTLVFWGFLFPRLPILSCYARPARGMSVFWLLDVYGKFSKMFIKRMKC